MPRSDDDDDRFPLIVLDLDRTERSLHLRELLDRASRTHRRGEVVVLDLETTPRELLPVADYSEIELRVLRGIEERALREKPPLEDLLGFMPHYTPRERETAANSNAAILESLHRMMVDSLRIPADLLGDPNSSADMLRWQHRALEERCWRYGSARSKLPEKPR